MDRAIPLAAATRRRAARLGRNPRTRLGRFPWRCTMSSRHESATGADGRTFTVRCVSWRQGEAPVFTRVRREFWSRRPKGHSLRPEPARVKGQPPYLPARKPTAREYYMVRAIYSPVGTLTWLAPTGCDTWTVFETVPGRRLVERTVRLRENVEVYLVGEWAKVRGGFTSARKRGWMKTSDIRDWLDALSHLGRILSKT